MVRYDEVKIPQDGDMPRSVVLWLVQGINGYWWPTKYCAEIAARQRFPDESEEQRYARIFYDTFVRERDL